MVAGRGPPGCVSTPPPGIYKHFPWAGGEGTAISGCGILSPCHRHRCGAQFSRAELQIAPGARGGFLQHSPKLCCVPPPAMCPSTQGDTSGDGAVPATAGLWGGRRAPPPRQGWSHHHHPQSPHAVGILRATQVVSLSPPSLPCQPHLVRPDPSHAAQNPKGHQVPFLGAQGKPGALLHPSAALSRGRELQGCRRGRRMLYTTYRGADSWTPSGSCPGAAGT